MYNEILTLIDKVDNGRVDEFGDPVKDETYAEVFCDVKSIGVNEFYQAQTLNCKPEIKAIIADYYDYNGEQEAILCGYRYKVLRTYRKETNQLEITLYGGVRCEHS